MKKSLSTLEFKHLCLKANKQIFSSGLVFDTFGNASHKVSNNFVIKPSGINLMECTAEDMSIVAVQSGKLIEGNNPSSDTPTHLTLYRNFNDIWGITHTHSLYATAWAQAAKSIPCLGTTHADYWSVEIPVTRELTVDEINGEYELETGKVIVETIKELRVGPLECPGILVAHHGPFTWGRTLEEAVKNAERLEYIAKLAWMTLQIKPQVTHIPSELHNRHFSRKHGPDAYYGQKKS
jgi:L-ribulose-5-phosphate 4-epimerase